MLIQPVQEHQASEEVKRCYESLKTALGIHSLPLFFTYIGSFPEYLEYISDQLVKNFDDERFKTLIEESSLQFEDLIQSSLPASPDTTLVISAPNAIEKNLLPEYLRICRHDFDNQMKREQFLMARVTIERMLLGYIGLLPHLIFSPINVVLQLTSKYKNFPELLYLLSEHFPTYAVQRLMFSGYMRE